MNSMLVSFISQNRLLVLGFLVALITTLWFASHLVMDALYFSDPDHTDVDLRSWMTPRYIVLTYDLPRPFVLELLELDPQTDGGFRLGKLAEERNMTMEELTEFVRSAAATYREAQQ